MNKKLNILTMIFVIFVAMIGSVFADPITVEDVKVQEVNGDYVVLVSLENADSSSGTHTELDFTVDELGTTVTEDVVVSSADVLTFNLEDVVSPFSALTKGETYTLTVASDNNSASDLFFFGKETETDNSLGVVVEEISVNGVEVTDLDTLQVLNGQALNVAVRFSTLNSFDDARFRMSIDGYEHAVLDDSTEIFQVVAGKTYVKSMTLNLPADMNNQRDYVLRIVGTNDLSGVTYKELDLYVDTQRHRVDVVDLVMTPSSGVEPGQNIIANVRLKNRGQKSQDSVKVSVSIPELGVSESSYVGNLNTDEVVTSDDMLVYVPESASAKAYKVDVTLTYNDGYSETISSFNLNVMAPKAVVDKNLLVSFKNNIELEAGVATTFEVVIANPNKESKPISLAAVENSWADVELSPSLAMVQGGDSSTYKVTVTPKDSIAGEKSLALVVKEGAETVSEITVSTYVEANSGINWVNVALAVLLIIAIIVLLALVVTIAKRRGDDEEDEDMSSNEEYY